MKAYLCTIMPSYHCVRDAWREEVRAGVNEWMRAGAGGMAEVIDLDAAVRDPADSMRFVPEYDSGDNLHPSLAGSKRMAEVIYGALMR